jgi:hypothetical protein
MARKGHSQKSPAQRQAYNRYVKQLDYEPTVDEALPFPTTSQGGEELSEQTTKRRRDLNVKERCVDHLRENWIGWVISLVTVLLGWLMIGSKIEIARLNIVSEGHSDDLKEVKESSQKNLEKNIEQDLTLKEHGLRIEFLNEGAKKLDTPGVNVSPIDADKPK